MTSSVDQYSRSARPKPVPSSSSFPTYFFQVLRAPFANARETEHYRRHTQEGYRGMRSDALDPGGEVRGCPARCTIAMSDVSPFVWVQLAGPYKEFPQIKNCFLMWVCVGCGKIIPCSDWHKIFFCFRSILHVILKVVRTPHITDLCCVLPEVAAAEDTSRAAVQCTSSLLIPCAHGKLSVQHHRTAPKPEIHIMYMSQ